MAGRPSAVYGGRRLLLDTHALLWWLSGDTRLSRAARRAIADESATVFVSAASAWEVATKARLGKLSDPLGLADALGTHLAAQGFQELPITLEHGRRAGKLPGPHKDLFDRMLIAQAQTDGLAVVSNETVFDGYGVQRVW
ncbi:MAG: type II toxin-antitoxin system VapC family toxin [Gemmatimonadetes bacterium]|nr:type II toxin-antitoxin system VapC family toxin [Gemmatimonadota bacterium]